MRKTKTGLILAGVLLLFSGLNALRADNAKVNGFDEEPITWGDSHDFEHNHNKPSITSLPDGSVVQIHKSDNDFGLWYSVGKVNIADKTITWGAGHEFGRGENPSITSFPDGTVVEVHHTSDGLEMWYSIGEVDVKDKTITWGAGHEFGRGENPSITSFPDGTVVEVHQANNGDELWYSVGKVSDDKKTITWGASHEFDSGEDPSITSLPDGKSVVQIHTSENDYTLWYSIGEVNVKDKTITWGDSHKFDNGRESSITAFPGGKSVVQIHRSENNFGLWYSIGEVNVKDKTITWGDSYYIEDGQTPSITSLSDSSVVQIHRGVFNADSYSIKYQVGSVCSELQF